MRLKLLVASAATVASAALLGCFDVIAPGSPHGPARASLSLAPVFGSADDSEPEGIPNDVDLIRITLHHPPALDTTYNFSIEEGQDSIRLEIPVTLNGTGFVDTVGVTFQAVRTSDGVVLYSGTQSFAVSTGPPTTPAPLVATYVGPGLNIESIAVTPRTVVIKPNTSFTFGCVALDSSGWAISGMPELWASRNTAVVTVNAAGVARGVALGSTYVVLTSGARSAVKDSALVTVSNAAAPTIALSAATAGFVDTLLTTDPAPLTINVTNSGGGVLSGLSVGAIAYGAGATGWLVASLAATTAPTTLTLQAAKGSLAAGTYTATVPVQASVAGNSPQSVAVTFTIAPAPTLALSGVWTTFRDTLFAGDPAAQTVTVTSSGGTVSGLSLGTITYDAAGSGWLAASLSTTATPATLTLRVAKGSLGAGTYTAVVPVRSAAAANSPQSDTVTLAIVPPPLATLTGTPGYGVLLAGGTLTYAVTGKDAANNPVTPLGLTYTSRSPAVATVSSAGLVTAVSSGTAVIVTQAPAAAGTAADSMLVVVPATGSPVVAAVGDGRAFDLAGAGSAVTLLVLVDLRGVPGDTLGSYNAELDWNPSQLAYVSWSAVAGGFATPTVNPNNATAGQLRFSSADASGSGGAFALIQVTFTAAAAGTTPLTLTLTDLSTTAANNYAKLLPVAVIVSGSATVH